MNLRINCCHKALFLLLLLISIVGPVAANPFAEQSQITIRESTSLDASEAQFNKVNKADAKDDSRDKPVTVAVLSDLHCRPANHDALVTAIKAINKLPGIYATAITGDLVEKIGSPAEYSYLIKTLSNFSVPILAVQGNHDMLYKDHYNPNKNAKNPKLRTTPSERKAKIERFRKLLKLKAPRYTRKVGGHLLVFLPNDDLNAKCLVRLSETTLDFLAKTLKENHDMPTIIFCHGPLMGSYHRKGGLTLPQATAQPAEKIRKILKKNPQVFLWVSGHVHMSPSSSNFCAKVNKVDKVTNIHTPAVQPSIAWVQVLKLSPDKAVVRTYNPKTKKFVKKFDRVFKHKVVKDKPKKDEEKDKQPDKTTPAPSDDESQKPEEQVEEQPVEEQPADDTVIDNDNPQDAVEEDPDEEELAEESSDQNQDGLEETSDDADETAAETTETTESADADARAIERIRELISIAMEYINNLFSNFIRILRP